MSELLEGWEARTEYTLWYDNGNDDDGTVELGSLSDAEQFKLNNNVYKEERYVGNIE